MRAPASRFGFSEAGSHRRLMAVLALGAYIFVSFLYFGLPVASHPGRPYIGSGVDPEIFIWMFAWWPHALLHGLDPFRTQEIWVPATYDLAWTTSVPGLAVLFAPVTLLAGPVVAYNLAAVLMPALAAWTAYLLCRHITGKVWPSLVGGYLFGFSAYMLGQQMGHLHMTSVFLLPLVALVVLRYLEGSLGGRALTLHLGLLLGVEIWFSTELFLTLTLALAVALAVAYLVAPARRHRLRSMVLPISGGYVLALVFASPLLAAMLVNFQSGSINYPRDYPADLLNPIVPTRLILTSAWWASGISGHFRNNDAENDAYLGLPALFAFVLFVRGRWRTAGARFLTITLGLTLFAALGTELHVAGHRVVSLPWEVLSKQPLFDNLLPSRLALYSSLVVAVAVAGWAATTPHRRLAIVLPTLAVIALVPRLGAGFWKQTPIRPPFFASGLYRTCLVPGESILAIPYNWRGDSILWQAESGFSFRLAEGYVTSTKPASYENEPGFAPLRDDEIPSDPREVISFARSKGVTTIIVQEKRDAGWGASLSKAVRPRPVGGAIVFPLIPGPTTTGACAASR
jgi:hypothetical protein